MSQTNTRTVVGRRTIPKRSLFKNRTFLLRENTTLASSCTPFLGCQGNVHSSIPLLLCVRCSLAYKAESAWHRHDKSDRVPVETSILRVKVVERIFSIG